MEKHPNLVGKKINTYLLEQLIAAGGFGTVYQAHQDILERKVAIKVANEEFNTDPRFILQFQREVKIAAGLEHRHIIPIYDYWRNPEGAYMVMRLMPNSLSGILGKPDPISLGQIVEWTVQIANALAFAHRRGIVHLDIKPDNILIDEDRDAYLTDFGIATLVRSRGDDIRVGSLGYLSPEQIRGEPVTPQSDIFSLGILLYTMITRELPFQGSQDEMIQFTLFMPITSLQSRNDQIPQGIDAVIQRATAKSAESRYNNAGEFMEELRAAASRVSDLLLYPEMDVLISSDTPPTNIFPASGTNALPGGGVPKGTQPLASPETGALAEDGFPDDTRSLASQNAATLAGGAAPTDKRSFASPETTTLPGGGVPQLTWNPYKGLQAYDEIDADMFFGRGRWTSKVLEALGNEEAPSRLLVLAGPSGSGKSSLVRAGVLPQVIASKAPAFANWQVLTLTAAGDPTRDVQEAIYSLVSEASTRSMADEMTEDPSTLHRYIEDAASALGFGTLLLFIDQFEVYFKTAVDDAARDALLANLIEATQGDDAPLRLIVTLRSDFLEGPLIHPVFGAAARRGLHVL
ncbi:MAG: protein kinase, partial [Chloroflexota bacterium]